MDGVQLVLPGEIVRKSNALMRCRWNIDSVWEPRLVALMTSMINVDDDDFLEYEIPVKKIIPDEKKGGNSYKDIEKVVDNVMSRIITIYNDLGWTKYHLFSVCRYNREKNIITLKFDPELKPHFLKLKEQFTKYNLIEFMLLSSIYSQRIFEILKSWDDGRKEKIINIDDLHNMIESPAYIRNSFKEFRSRVLEKSHKDITKKTSFRYKWETIKKWRSIVAIRFIFETPKEKIKIKQQTNHITKLQTNTVQFNTDYNSAVNCLIAHPTTCTPHIDNAPEVCAVCPRYRNIQKN